MKIIASSRDVCTHWPLPVLLALQQRHHDGLREEHAGGEVRNRDADAHGALARQAGDRHQAAHALRDLVDAGSLGIGAGLAETGDAAVDDARVDPRYGFIVDAEALVLTSER